MTIPADESRLKELIKTAIVEVLEERRDLFRPGAAGPKASDVQISMAKTIAFWTALLVIAVLLYRVFAAHPQ